MRRALKVVEVGPRDGLQNEPKFKSLSENELVNVRANFVMSLADAGLNDVEAGAFVRADKVPQMVATNKVLLKIQQQRPDLWKKKKFWSLVPNRRGLDDALAAQAKHIAVFTATSDAFNQRNIMMTVQESLAEIREIVRAAKRNKLRVRGYVSTVWGCPYAGAIPPKNALHITSRLLDMGVEEVSLGDTIGVATPNKVHDVLKLFKKDWPLAVHFHDTRGTAIANSLRAIDEGIHVIDSATGGLGGCPYAKGASGNLATEDLLYMLHGMRFTTGVNIDNVCAAGETVAQALELKLPSRYHSAWKAAKKGKE